MENAIKDRFIFTYESGVSGSFLVASTSKNEAIIEFQVNMLSKNPNKYILPLDVRRNNDSINIYYNITSKLSLLQYLKRSKLSKNEFIDIFSGIVKTLLTSKGFLLSDKSFVLDEEYIFICPDSMRISLVYLPFKFDVDITRALKDFAMNFVVYNANIDEEDSDVFLQQFISFLKKDTFNILDFDKFLKTLKRNAEPKQEVELLKQEIGTKEGQNQLQNEKPVIKVKGLEKEKFKVEIPKPKTVKDKNPKPIQVAHKDVPGDIKKKTEITQRPISILKGLSLKPNMIIGCVLQSVIAIIILWLLLSGMLDRLGNDKLSTLFGLLLIGGAASYFVWKKILSMKTVEIKSVSSEKAPRQIEKPVRPPKPINTSQAQETDNTVSRQIGEVAAYDMKKVIKGQSSLRAAHIDSVIEENCEVPKVEKQDSKNINVNETVFLGSVTKKPQLRISKDGIIEEIDINKPSFIIGRLEGHVDYVYFNNAIGKVHAEILTRAGCYYLKDLNSKNGTYINGKRIESNKEYELKNNDRITLANSEFLFVIG